MSERPALDHSLLSPSGRMTKRARTTALARETARMFPPGYWDAPAQSVNERRAGDAKRLRLAAQNLRELAARGMQVRKCLKEASRLEAEASKLEED